MKAKQQNKFEKVYQNGFLFALGEVWDGMGNWENLNEKYAVL